MKNIIVLAGLIFLFTGCADKMSHDFLSKNIKKGVTSKEQVRNVMGQPSSTLLDSPTKGKETWIYGNAKNELLKMNAKSHISSMASSLPMGQYAGTALDFFDKDSEIKTLYIIFNKKGIVETYKAGGYGI